MKCSNCGNELEAGSRFCGSCGSPVNVPGPLSFDPPPAYIQSPAAGRPKKPPAPASYHWKHFNYCPYRHP